MCVVSMIMDHYADKWKKIVPQFDPVYPIDTSIGITPYTLPPLPPIHQPLTPEEINELRELLKRAKKYDEETGQKDCELESKKETLRILAKQLGVELNI